jgi:glycosyltransferase involved in cell wall biosynthesis
VFKEISVIIPVCNEAKIINENILMLEKFLINEYPSYEIIASEDGSTDGTDNILKLLAIKKNIVHIHSKKRLGKGRAINNAFRLSKGKYIYLIDADFPVDISNIPIMIKLLENYDIAIGSRAKKESVIERSFIRLIFSLSYNMIVRFFFRTGVLDHQCGVKAFKRNIMEDLLPNMKEKGFIWDTEFLVEAKMRGYKILEVPIKWNDRKFGNSKISFYKDSYIMGMELLKLWTRFLFDKKLHHK